MDDGLIQRTSIFISSRAHLNLSFNLCESGMTTFLTGGTYHRDSEDTFVLQYVNRGTVLLTCEQFEFRVEAGKGFFLFPDMEVTLQNIGSESAELVWMIFTGYQVEIYLGRANVFRSQPIFVDPDGTMGTLINQMHQAAQHFPNRYCKMMAMMYQLFGYMLGTSPIHQPNALIDASNYYAGCAIEYIHCNYTAAITVDDIAQALQITRKRLYAAFRDVFHITPKQYLIYYRIEKACKQLKTTDRPVQEIAEMVGYASPFYFSKEFKRLIGIPPSQYRTALQDSEICSYRIFAPALNDSAQEIVLPVFEKLSEETYDLIE